MTIQCQMVMLPIGPVPNLAQNLGSGRGKHKDFRGVDGDPDSTLRR
jgi:hypothetical protein